MPDGTTNVPVEQVIALVAKDMSELAVLQRLSTPIPPSFLTPPPSSSPPTRTNNSPKHHDQFNASLLLPRVPALSSRNTPSLFEMQTMGYGFRGAHIGCPHGVTPRLDPSKGAVEVPPCPSPRIQSQDGSAPISSKAAVQQRSLPQVDDQVRVSYHYSSELLRMLTFYCYL